MLFDGDSSVPKSRMTFILFIILKQKVVLWMVLISSVDQYDGHVT